MTTTHITLSYMTARDLRNLADALDAIDTSNNAEEGGFLQCGIIGIEEQSVAFATEAVPMVALVQRTEHLDP